MSYLKTVTDSTFKNLVLGSKGMVMIEFWAPWCRPCAKLTPVLEDVAESLKNDLTIYKMNIDENMKVPTEYKIMAVPTLILFKDGTAVRESVEARTKSAIESLVKSEL